MSASVGEHSAPPHTHRVAALLQRIATDLSMIVEREVRVLSCDVARAQERAAGADVIHIALKQAYQVGERSAQGSLLVPLPDALSIAGYFLMLPDDVVEAHRAFSTVDAVTKDALLEVASFIAGSLSSAVGREGPPAVEVRSASCQGLRPGAAPALLHEPGGEWWVARARVQVHAFAPSELVWMLPSILDAVL